MIQWKDITTYTKRSPGRTPRSWQATFGPLRLVVSRNINYDPTAWIARCQLFDFKMLTCTDIDAAKGEAVLILRKLLHKALAAATDTGKEST